MKSVIGFSLAFGLLASGTALAQKVDLSTVKCAEFLQQDKDFHGQILMWLTAYSMSEDDDPVVDFDAVVASGKALGAYCAKNPQSGLIAAWENATK